MIHGKCILIYIKVIKGCICVQVNSFFASNLTVSSSDHMLLSTRAKWKISFHNKENRDHALSFYDNIQQALFDLPDAPFQKCKSHICNKSVFILNHYLSL